MTAKFEFRAAALIFGLLAAATYARIFFSVSIADEAFAVALAYLPRAGGQWFVNEQMIHQTAGILIYPFVLPYSWLFGSTGVVLYIRHLHFLLSLFVAAQAYFIFKRINGAAVALVLSSVVVTFVPHGMSTLNYNNLGSLLFGLSTLLAVRAFSENRRDLAAASGGAWVACVFAYPSFLLVFLVFAPPALIYALNNSERRNRFFKPFALAMIGAAALAVLVLISCGVENVRLAYEYSKTFAQAGAFAKLKYAAAIVWWYLPSPEITYGLVLVWICAGFYSRSAGLVAYFVFVAAVFIRAGHFESSPPQVLWPVLQLFALVYVLQRKLKFSSDERFIFWLIIIPAIVGSVVTCLSSRMTLYVMCLPAVFGALSFTSIQIGDRKALGALCALLLSCTSVFWHWSQVYEDGPIATLTHRMESGPFAGLYTSPQKAAWIDNIQDALKEFKIQGRTIIFKDIFAAGYLMADNIPLGPVLYFGPNLFYPEVRPRYAQIFQDRNYWPEIVFDIKFYPADGEHTWIYNLPGDHNQNDPFKNFFQKTGAYRVLIDRPAFQVLERR